MITRARPQPESLAQKREQATEPSRETEKPLKPISKLHLLVHPGYDLDTLNKRGYATSSKLEQARVQLEKYILTAQQLKKTSDFLIIFSHQKEQDYKKSLQSGTQHAIAINVIKELLGTRALILFEDEEIHFAEISTTPQEKNFQEALDESLSETRNNFLRLQEKIKQTGHTLDPQNVEVDAFGEDLTECLYLITRGLHQAGNFKTPFKIILPLTDRPEASADQIAQTSRLEFVESYPNY